MGPGDGSGGIYLYDIPTATWTRPTTSGPAPSGFRTDDASVFCDVASDVVSVLHYTGRTVYTFDPDASRWTSAPFPAGVLASTYDQYHGFHDPELGVYFVFEAADSEDDGRMWAYRPE